MSADGKPSTDQEKLTAALEAIKEVMVARDIRTTRSSLSKLESQVSSDLDGLKKKTNEALAEMTRELESRVDAMTASLDKAAKEREKAMSALELRLAEAADRLESSLRDAQKAADERMKKTKTDMEAAMASSDEALRAELGSLGQSVAALQVDLQQQADTTHRVSGLLSNMATVFNAGPAAPQTAPPQLEEENVDSALDGLFGDEIVVVDKDDPKDGDADRG